MYYIVYTYIYICICNINQHQRHPFQNLLCISNSIGPQSTKVGGCRAVAPMRVSAPVEWLDRKPMQLAPVAPLSHSATVRKSLKAEQIWTIMNAYKSLLLTTYDHMSRISLLHLRRATWRHITAKITVMEVAMKLYQNSLVLGTHQKSCMPLSHLAKSVCTEQPWQLVCMEQPWQRQHLPVESQAIWQYKLLQVKRNMDRKPLWFMRRCLGPLVVPQKTLRNHQNILLNKQARWCQRLNLWLLGASATGQRFSKSYISRSPAEKNELTLTTSKITCRLSCRRWTLLSKMGDLLSRSEMVTDCIGTSILRHMWRRFVEFVEGREGRAIVKQYFISHTSYEYIYI